METARVHEGLEGVLVARTALSRVEGESGTLTVAGHAIEALASERPFEAIVGLLLDGALPDPARLREHRAELGAARGRAHARLASLTNAGHASDAMRSLSTALTLLPSGASAHDALGVAAVATAAWICGERGSPLPPPRPELAHAHDLLRMASVEEPSEGAARLLDAYLVTVAEHGLNASTFAARVTASTGAELACAVLSGVATLSGPLHGGAPGPVLDMLDAVGTPERAAAYVRSELAAGRRIMGMGHRVYRVRDPRAFVLERALAAYQVGPGPTARRLELARAVEAAAEAELASRYPGRALRANVEFFTALLLEALRVPRGAFTAVFACGRVLGYAAHYAEQRRTGRLIRPAALYVGP